MLKTIISKSNLCLFLFLAASFTAVVNLQQKNLSSLLIPQTDIQRHISQAKMEQANLELIARSPAFGFDNLVADWMLFKFLQYYGNVEARNHTDYSLSTQYFQTLVDRDPNFTRAYFRIAPAVTLKAGRPKETVKILKQGLSQISPELYRANYLWVYKAVDELLFLGDAQAAEESLRTASRWSALIGDKTREESTLKTANFLAQDPNSTTVQVGAWYTVWVGAPDIETRNMAQQNIERLGGRLEITEDGRAIAYPPQENPG